MTTTTTRIIILPYKLRPKTKASEPYLGMTVIAGLHHQVGVFTHPDIDAPFKVVVELPLVLANCGAPTIDLKPAGVDRPVAGA
jgi:hypothetical protein